MIAVTGLGAITALGGSAVETWERLLRGDRGFREVSLFSTEGYRSEIAGEVTGMDRIEAGGDASRTSELGLIAAREALASAGLARDVVGTDAPWGQLRVGLVMGGSTAGMLETEAILSVLLGPEGTVDPVARERALGRMLSHPLSAPTDRLARELGPFARVRSLSSACSSGSNAIIVGAAWLESDLVDVVLCGAADALCQVTLGGFNALGALDPDGARPFDRDRKGLTLGEGAGFLVLEDIEAARARGARVICTLVGWASRSEAHHITNPEASGQAPARAMNEALARAGLTAADVDYVNAHGTGTPLNDPMETKALARVFGSDLSRVPVSSSKGQIGHTLAAAGAIEAIITVMSIDHGRIPPTGGLVDPDPACQLHHVHTANKREIRAALSSSFGFGGMDSVLLFANAPAEVRQTRRPSRRVVVTGVATLTPAGLFDGVDVSRLPSFPSCGDAIGTDALGGLDAHRARRLDRTSRIAAVVAERALGGIARNDVGIILGSAFGAIDATAAFMRRLAEKGPRFASPADFPSLVPSSPAGHVSIYLGLEGPAMVVADLSTSGECAVTQGFEFIVAGEMDDVVAVAVEERSAIVEQVLRVLFGAPTSNAATIPARREGAAAVALSSEEAARVRGLPILAEIEDIFTWTSNTGPPANLAAPSKHGGVVVVGAPNAAVDECVARSSWAPCARIVCSDHAGAHEAVGGIAVAVAAAIVARGEAASALCVGSARGSGYALFLRGFPR